MALLFTAVGGGEFTLTFTVGLSWDGILQYSTDNENWTDLTLGTVTSVTAESIYLQGTNTYVINSHPSAGGMALGADKSFNCSGNIMDLLGTEDMTSNDTFTRLFENSLIQSAPELPATTLTIGCYWRMFMRCPNLITPPALPATTLADDCYTYMFMDCWSLAQAPALPATTLTNRCYEAMFSGCTSLTAAPELPATTLATSCYKGMFEGCKALTTTPTLPATTLANDCYYGMFSNCSYLTEPTDLPATTLAENCYYSMFKSCNRLTSIPKLPNTELPESCFAYMFADCNSIKYSTTPTQNSPYPHIILATSTADNSLRNMFTDRMSTDHTPEINTRFYLSVPRYSTESYTLRVNDKAATVNGKTIKRLIYEYDTYNIN